MVTHRVDALDALFVGLSVLGSLGAVWIVVGLFLTVRWRRPRVVLLVMAGVLTADLLALAAKLLFGRARPYVDQPLPEPLVTTPLDLSFPSGHAATAFAGATLIAAVLPRVAVPLYLLAGAVAWSRVYVGVHYPLDVFFGAVLGIAVGATFLALERSRSHRSGSKDVRRLDRSFQTHEQAEPAGTECGNRKRRRGAGSRALRWPGAGRRQ